MKLELLETFQDSRDNYESLFTILIHNASKKVLVKDIHERLRKIQNITKKYKKNKLRHRLQSILDYVNDIEDPIFHKVFLIGDNIHCFDLDASQIQLLQEYEIKTYQFWNNTYFNIEYLKDIFTNHELFHVVEIEKHSLRHYKLNQHKRKHITKLCFPKNSFTEKLQLYLQQINKDIIVTGNIDKIQNSKIIYHSAHKLSRKQLCKVHQIGTVQKNIPKLQELFQKLENPKQLHLVIYGENEIIEAVRAYQVKTLFLHQKMEKKFANIIEAAYLNFDICKMITLQPGDISDKLLHDFGGFMAEAYY